MKTHNRPGTDFSGLFLDKPRSMMQEPSFLQKFFTYIFFVFLGISGTGWCLFSAFSIPVNMGIFVLSILLFSALTVGTFLGKHKIIVSLSFCAVWTVLVIIFKESFVQGFIRIVNFIMDKYTENSDYNFSTYLVDSATPVQAQAQITLFAVMAVFLLSVLMAWFLICKKWTFFCFLLTLPFLIASLVYTIVPDYAACFLLLAFWAMLLLEHNGLHGQLKIQKRRGGYSASNFGGTARGAAFLFPTVAAFILLLSLLFPAQAYSRSDLLDQIRTSLIKGIQNFSFFSNQNAIGNSKDRLELNQLGDLKYTGKTVLRVKAGYLENIHLKGFVGSQYTGFSWEPLPNTNYDEMNAQMGRYAAQNFPYYFYDQERQSWSSETRNYRFFSNAVPEPFTDYDLTIQNINVNPKSIYTPYLLKDLPANLPNASFFGDTILQSNQFGGTGEYTLHTAAPPSQAVPTKSRFTTLFNSMVYKDSMFYVYGSKYFYFVPSSEIFSNNNIDLSELYENNYPQELLDDMRRTLDENTLQFYLKELAYSDFVYKNYLQLPENLRSKLQKYSYQQNLLSGSTLAERIQAVAENVKRSGVYTLTPPKVPEGRDFVDYFLFESNEGYCVHFATTAVALLRAQGIPARYVEGYTVAPSDFSGVGEWADIPDYRAHAWAEYYYPGIGWLPLEVTPGYDDGHTPAESATNASAAPSSEPESLVPSSSSAAPSPSSTASLPGTASSAADDASEKDSLNHQLLFVALFFAAILALLLFAFLVRRAAVISHRNKKSHQPDRNKAALSIYLYIQKLIRCAPSLSFEGKMPEELFELVLRARFSQHILEETDVQQLYAYAQSLAQKTYQKLPPLRRIWYKYALCLI